MLSRDVHCPVHLMEAMINVDKPWDLPGNRIWLAGKSPSSMIFPLKPPIGSGDFPLPCLISGLVTVIIPAYNFFGSQEVFLCKISTGGNDFQVQLFISAFWQSRPHLNDHDVR